MVTGAEGITGLVLVGILTAAWMRSKASQNYRLSLPARQTESPRWLIAIPGKVVKTLAISFAELCLAVKGGDKNRNAKLT